jgi:16S rRNA (guanine527-N7)-methyltransferase
VSDPRAALDVHVADSLSALELPGVAGARRVAELGAGAGFPGLVLAIALPHARVDLIESAGRKAALIERLAREAEIANARAVTARAEEWGGRPPALGGGAEAYDLVTARALASLPVLCEYAAPLLAEGGWLVAWKAAVAPDELAGGRAAASVLGLEPAAPLHVVPYAGARDHTLHAFCKIAPTPERFPRRPGMAVKRPLTA